MVAASCLALVRALLLPLVASVILVHAHEDSASAEVGAVSCTQSHNATLSSNITVPLSPQSYFTYGNHSGLMLAHIAFITLGWFFVLPVGTFKFGVLPGRNMTNTKSRRSAEYYALRPCEPSSALVSGAECDRVGTWGDIYKPDSRSVCEQFAPQNRVDFSMHRSDTNHHGPHELLRRSRRGETHHYVPFRQQQGPKPHTALSR